MRYRAILFDVGGPIDMEFAWEIAVDGAIASACGLEGIRVDQAMIDEASEAAVAAFADDRPRPPARARDDGQSRRLPAAARNRRSVAPALRAWTSARHRRQPATGRVRAAGACRHRRSVRVS